MVSRIRARFGQRTPASGSARRSGTSLDPDRPGDLEIQTDASTFTAIVGAAPFTGNTFSPESCGGTSVYSTATLSLSGLVAGRGYKYPNRRPGSSWSWRCHSSWTGAVRALLAVQSRQRPRRFPRRRRPHAPFNGVDVTKYEVALTTTATGCRKAQAARTSVPTSEATTPFCTTAVPDDDKDGVPEGAGGSDRCPDLAGNKADEHRGCPDDDGDGVARGPGRGRPLPGANPDTQGRPDKNKDGCSDHIKIQATASFNVQHRAQWRDHHALLQANSRAAGREGEYCLQAPKRAQVPRRQEGRPHEKERNRLREEAEGQEAGRYADNSRRDGQQCHRTVHPHHIQLSRGYKCRAGGPSRQHCQEQGARMSGK